jgi:hypothetical protein
VAPLEVLKPDAPDRLRKKREQAWISRLKPVLNRQQVGDQRGRTNSSSRASSVSPSSSPVVSPSLRRKLRIPSRVT